MEKIYDRHHILPRSREGSSVRDNIVRLDVRKHKALHMLFDNRTPIEQIERILGINATALTEQFKDDISRILGQTDDEYFYKTGIIKRT